ncbi:MAG: hypothetical protein SGPRY_010392, partial [Prymnesium sp.]
MLDVVLFRTDQGGDPELIRESQRRRYADVSLVDKVIEYDTEWRKTRGALDIAKKNLNANQKEIGQFMKKKETPPEELITKKKGFEQEIADLEKKEAELIANRDATIGMIGELCVSRRYFLLCIVVLLFSGNLVPDSVPVDDDEDNNLVVDTYGACDTEDWMLSHYDLVQMAGLANTTKGAEVAGSRGYFLTGPGVLLNQARPTPTAATHQLRCWQVAQLADFDEQLYKVTGSGEDQYLIATSEQPICAYHANEWLDPKQLPIKYAGYSTCFRKEAGSHGRDQLGIFRVHQFEKVEQFSITSPEGEESWEMQEVMLNNCKEFYQSLAKTVSTSDPGLERVPLLIRACAATGIPYRVVNIVSGALNDAAAKKYDLEAWFPGSKAHRELVSCSNCTDFQSRRLEVRFGQKTAGETKKRYVHMLNSTLIATERAMCCVIENYQTKSGIK